MQRSSGRTRIQRLFGSDQNACGHPFNVPKAYARMSPPFLPFSLSLSACLCLRIPHTHSLFRLRERVVDQTQSVLLPSMGASKSVVLEV